MAQKSPEKFSFMEDTIIKLHMEYLKTNTIKNKLKVPQISVSEDVIKAIVDFNKEIQGDEKEDEETVIREGMKRIIHNVDDCSAQGQGLEVLVYDFLKTIYIPTCQFEKYQHFNQLLNVYQTELINHGADFSQPNLRQLLRLLVPYLNLEIVIKQLQEYIPPSKCSLIQIIESIKYPRITREDCYHIIYNKLKSTDFEIVQFELKSLGKGLGYLGDHYKLKIRIKQHGKKDEYLHDFFAKFIPTINKTSEEIAKRVFMKEEFVYKQLIPLMERCKLDKLLDFAPTCYYSIENEFIVLEDLSKFGFATTNITVPANYHWMLLLTKTLSKFHACSIILDKMLSKETSEITDVGKTFDHYLEEIMYNKKYKSFKLMNFGCELISDYFADQLSCICKKLTLEEFKKQIKIEVERILQNVKRSNKFYNVICHGDIWSNNIMSNDKMKCVLIDYQLIRYCPPALDLLCTIYTNTNREFRLKYMDEMSKLYYDSLKHNLNLYQVDLQDICEHSAFIESLDYYKSTAIIQSLAGLQLNLLPKESLVDALKSEESSSKFYFEDRKDTFDAAWSFEPFCTRIKELMEDLYEVCEKIHR